MKRRRVKVKNYPLAVKLGKRRLTFRELVDRFGITKAAAIYRKLSKSYSHGRLLFKQIGSLKKAHKESWEPKWAAKKAERILRSRFAKKKRKVSAKKHKKAKAKKAKTKARKAKKIRATPKAKKKKAGAKPKTKAKAKKHKKAKATPKAKARKSKKRTKAAKKAVVKAAKRAKAKAKKAKAKRKAKAGAKAKARAAKKHVAPKLTVVKPKKSGSVPGWPSSVDSAKLAAVKGAFSKAPHHASAAVAGVAPTARLGNLKNVAKGLEGVLAEKNGVQIRGYGKGTQRLSWGEFLQYVLYLNEGSQRPKSQWSVVDFMRNRVKEAKTSGIAAEHIKAKEEQIRKFAETQWSLKKKLGRAATTQEVIQEAMPEIWGMSAKRAAAN